MIITGSGKSALKNSTKPLIISKVIFSDFKLTDWPSNDISTITEIQGNKLITVEPTVALLSSGHALIHAETSADYKFNSAFVFAYDGQFTSLLAVTNNHSGSLDAELNVDALKKINFDSISSDLVRKAEVASLVTSEFETLSSNADKSSSYASEAYNRAIAYASSIIDIESSNASLYANQAYSSANSYADSQLKFKANVSDLIQFVNKSNFDTQLSSKANNSDLELYATKYDVNSSISDKSIDASNNARQAYLDATSYTSSVAANKADLSSLSSYATNTDLNNVSSEINDKLASKANVIDLTSYADKNSVSSLYSALSNSFNINSGRVDSNTSSIATAYSMISANSLALLNKANASNVDAKLSNKADISELSQYVTNSQLSSFASMIPSSANLTGYVTEATLSSYATTNELSNYATNSALSSYITNDQFDSANGANSSAINDVSNRLSNYATNSQLSSVVSNIPASVNLSGYVQENSLSIYATRAELSEYATSSQLEAVISSIPARVDLSSYVTGDKLSVYALKNDLSEYATNESLNDYVRNNELSSYATNSQLSSAMNNIDLTSYATNDKLSSYALNSELSNYATNNQLSSAVNSIDLSSYVTNDKLSSYDSQLSYNTNTKLNSYATNEQLSSVANTIPASVNLSGYVTESTLSSYALNSDLSNYATSNELATLKNTLSSYATTSDVYSAASNYATNSYADSVAKSAAIGATNWINILSNGVDLNKVTGVGRHVLLPNNNYINFPPGLNSNNEAYMHVIPDNFGNASQHVVCAGDNVEAVRFKSNGAWTDWMTGATLDYVNTAVANAKSYADTTVANLNNVISSLSIRLDNWIPSGFKSIMYNAIQAPIGFDATGSIYPNGTVYKANAISDIKGMPTDFINSIGIPDNSPALIFYNHEYPSSNGGWKILNVALSKDGVIFAFNILAKTSNAKDFKSVGSSITGWGQGWLNYSNKVGASPFTVANGTVTTR